MDTHDSKPERRSISKKVYIALGCIVLVLIIGVTVYSQALRHTRIPLVELYIVEDGGSIDFIYKNTGVIENGKLIVTVNFEVDFNDVFLLHAIFPGIDASLSAGGRETTGVVTAFTPTPENTHIWEIEIAQDSLVFNDGESVYAAIYCEDVQLGYPVVPAKAVVRVNEMRHDIYVLDQAEGPWGRIMVAVAQRQVTPWPTDESTEYVYLIGAEVSRPVIISTDTGDLYDGMEVRTARDFIFDFDSVPPPRVTLQDDGAGIIPQVAEQDDREDRITFPVKEGLSGTLRISSALHGFTYALAEGFMELYPDVEIIIDSIHPDSDFLDPATYIDFANQLRVQLMSGVDVPDIINLIGSIDFVRAANSGLLIDLYPFWNNDPDIIHEDYFTNIIELYEHNGGLFAMPTIFHPAPYRINKRVTEPLGINVDDLDAISVLELLDIFIRAQDEGVIGDDFKFLHGDVGPMAIMRSITQQYFDQRTGTARFDTPEFIEILEKADRLPRRTTVFNTWYTTIAMSAFEEQNDAFISSGLMFVDRMPSLYQSTALTSQPIFISCVDGSIITEITGFYSISSASENPELAWEFIKFLILESEETPRHTNPGRWDGDRWWGHIPINRNNFYKYMKTTLDRGFGFDIDMYEELLSIIERVGIADSFQFFVNELRVLDILTLYFDQGLITAEEAARQLQERAEIILNE